MLSLLVNKQMRIRDARQTGNSFVHAHRVMEMLCVGWWEGGGMGDARGRTGAPARL